MMSGGRSLTSELLRRVVEVPRVRLDNTAVIHQAVDRDTKNIVNRIFEYFVHHIVNIFSGTSYKYRLVTRDKSQMASSVARLKIEAAGHNMCIYS